MIQTVVPAQVTTVEDLITSKLSLNQLLLLVTPIFAGSIFFFLAPPFGRTAFYKVVCIVSSFFICVLLAVRIRGKLVLFWLTLLLRYNTRPRFYVFNKCTISGREGYIKARIVEDKPEQQTITRKIGTLPSLSTAHVVELERLMKDPAANIQFETNKQGGLYVRITEI